MILSGSILAQSCSSIDSVKVTEPVHTLVLICEDDNGQLWQSRLAILSVENDKTESFDYGLTAAHSVSGQKSCFVEDNQGNVRPVLDARTSTGFGSGDPYSPASDWAVLKIERMKTRGLFRFSLNDTMDRAELVSTAYIPKGRGLFRNTKPCSLEIIRMPVPPNGKFEGFPSHDCITIGGQSGTPMTIMSETSGQYLIGVLTGRTFLWPQGTDQPPRWIGRFIPIDRAVSLKILTEIEKLDGGQVSQVKN